MMKILKFLFGSYLSTIERNAFHHGVAYEKQQRRESDNKISEFIVESYVGHKGIICPNEWVDPVFINITGGEYICNNTQLVHSYVNVLTGEPGFALVGTILPADEKMVTAVLKLNPFERWNLISSRNTMFNMWDKSYPLEQITDSDVLLKQLKDVGFL